MIAAVNANRWADVFEGVKMYETKTVLRTWYELGWYEGWEVYGYTEFDRSGFPRMAEIRRPTKRAPDFAYVLGLR